MYLQGRSQGGGWGELSPPPRPPEIFQVGKIAPTSKKKKKKNKGKNRGGGRGGGGGELPPPDRQKFSQLAKSPRPRKKKIKNIWGKMSNIL